MKLNCGSFLLRYSQNIMLLREQVVSTQQQVASLEVEPQQADPLREEQVKELQGQLETLRAKMHRMETLEKSFSAMKKQLLVRLHTEEDTGMRCGSLCSIITFQVGDSAVHLVITRFLTQTTN